MHRLLGQGGRAALGHWLEAVQRKAVVREGGGTRKKMVPVAEIVFLS